MQLLISFRPAEGAIIRILGLIERRGFMLRDLAVSDEDTDGSLVVDLAARDGGAPSRRSRPPGRPADRREVGLDRNPASRSLRMTQIRILRHDASRRRAGAGLLDVA